MFRKLSALVFPYDILYNFTVMKEYIVFDLEWNQNPYGKEMSEDHLTFEIIEIGAVKLDESLKVVTTFSRLICPQVYRPHHFSNSSITS